MDPIVYNGTWTDECLHRIRLEIELAENIHESLHTLSYSSHHQLCAEFKKAEHKTKNLCGSLKTAYDILKYYEDKMLSIERRSAYELKELNEHRSVVFRQFYD